MVRATQASSIVLPLSQSAPETVLDFLAIKFPQIPYDVWFARVVDGKVHWQNGDRIDVDSRYLPKQRVFYYREVVEEPKIPLYESIIYQDERIIIANKPHYLALHPSGQCVNECLVNRLRIKTGFEQLVPAHRLDRATAGLVILIKDVQHRDAYHGLFRDGAINKTYQALAPLTAELSQQYANGRLARPACWSVKNRLVKAEPSFLRKVISGEPNSHSEIALLEVSDGIGRFELSPITGRTHQLRVHMQSIGMSIVNDRCYPQLLSPAVDDYRHPLKLLAQRVEFSDPVSGRHIDIQLADLEL
ncbi:pseudouridine synthase [Shewanella psychrotolerans]|uniref:pseudouridine synthase n=1 Tax=Shewanella psychrotolerans TaxID=2864206 RepID=UPI001C65D045|nr:pseudouridine synthase [Shewanella psychrotolerans]QYK01040.1 pseudouridine synthase [Shewanella psychrotolerans]